MGSFSYVHWQSVRSGYKHMKSVSQWVAWSVSSQLGGRLLSQSVTWVSLESKWQCLNLRPFTLVVYMVCTLVSKVSNSTQGQEKRAGPLINEICWWNFKVSLVKPELLMKKLYLDTCWRINASLMTKKACFRTIEPVVNWQGAQSATVDCPCVTFYVPTCHGIFIE